MVIDFQLELFQILQDDAVKVLHSICQQIWKTQQWPQDWKRSVFIPIPKKGNAQIFIPSHNCTHLTHWQSNAQNSPSKASTDVLAGFRKGRGTRDQIANIHWIIAEKAMATHSSIIAWRIPGMGEPGGLLFMGSHRVRHDWSNLAAAAATGS